MALAPAGYFRILLRAILPMRFGLAAFFVPVVVFVLTLNGVWSTDYPTSILGLQYSLWINHSFSLGQIGHSVVNSVDIGTFNGNYYSEISPGFAIISLPFAAFGIMEDGNVLNVFGNLLLADELFLALASSIGCYFVYKMCRLFSGPVAGVLGGLTFAVATPLWPISTVIFIQGASVMFSTASVYFALRHVRVTHRSKDLVISGLLLGAASFVEYMSALFIIPLSAYLLIKRRNPSVLIAPFLVGPILWLLTNYLAFSNPLIFPEQLKSGPILGQFDIALVVIHALWYLVSPYRGILVFSPVLSLGMFEMYKMLNTNEVRREVFLFLALFAVVLLGYSSWRDWAGGLAYGPRFLLIGIPYLIVPLSILLINYGRTLRIAFFLLFSVSTIIEGLAVFTTAFSSAGDWFNYQLLDLNIPWFVRGEFATWWFGRVNAGSVLSLQLVAVLFFVYLISYCYYLLGRIPHEEEGILQKAAADS